MGRPFAESTLIAVAAGYEAHTDAPSDDLVTEGGLSSESTNAPFKGLRS